MPAHRLADRTPGPWAKWRTRKRAERCIRFIETYCRMSKGHRAGQLVKLGSFQRAWLRAALADGTSSAVLSVAKGNGKSTLLAGMAVWALFDPDESGAPQVPVVATTVGQAKRSVYNEALFMIANEPELERRCTTYSAIGDTRVLVPATNGELFPIANQVDGLQGLDPSVAILDEIGFHSVEVWQALLLASGKRPRSLVVGIGTQGVDRDNALAWLTQLHLEGHVPAGCHFRWYHAPEGCDVRDEAHWPSANPAMAEGFMNVDSMRTAVALSTEAQVRIFRLNQYGVDGVGGWLGDHGREVWARGHDPYVLRRDVPTYVGVDVGLRRDSTAVVAVQRRDDSRLHARPRIWTPTPDREVDVTDVMHYLRQLCAELDVQEIAYDPRLFDLPAKVLGDEGLPMLEFPQSLERMTPAVGSTYELIMRAELTHDGDALYAQQVLNAEPRHNQVGFTLAKLKSQGRIDAAVATCIGVDRALRSTRRRRARLIMS